MHGMGEAQSMGAAGGGRRVKGAGMRKALAIITAALAAFLLAAVLGLSGELEGRQLPD